MDLPPFLFVILVKLSRYYHRSIVTLLFIAVSITAINLGAGTCGCGLLQARLLLNVVIQLSPMIVDDCIPMLKWTDALKTLKNFCIWRS
jgi:hypothetical protein